MGELILVTGGARSGKSLFAERLARDSMRKVIYIATSIEIDDEMRRRIEKHKERRPKSWRTIEAPYGISGSGEAAGLLHEGCIPGGAAGLLREGRVPGEESIPSEERVPSGAAGLLSEGRVQGKESIPSEGRVPGEESIPSEGRIHGEERAPETEGGRAEGATAPIVVILDCITVMISNIMLQKVVNWENVTPYDTEMAEASVRAEINSLVNYAKELKGSVIVVTNEVGMGLVPQNVLGREFRDIAGRANQILAANSKAVYLCISGIPVKIK